MAKVQPHRLTEKELGALHQNFFAMLKELEKGGHLLPFLEGLLTKSELIMCARRVEIAKLLTKGLSYADIQSKLKVGQRTVESVDKWLSHFREYRTFFGKALEGKKHDKDYFPDSFKGFRKRYPMHFLLFNLVLDGK